MENTSIIVEQAKTYKQYIQGWAYIPPQDLVQYEKAYKSVYGN